MVLDLLRLVLNGVKQGGIISPIMFCVYIDDLLFVFKNLWCRLLHG